MPLSGMPSTSRKMATHADLTDDEMAKLIDLYQGHENLYNYNLRSYHDRDKARQSYRYIAVEMGKNWDEQTQDELTVEESDYLADIDGLEDEIRYAGPNSTEENVDLSEAMTWYPAITPPVGSKKDIFSMQKFKNVDNRARNLSLGLKSFKKLATSLASGEISDLAKVRAIFTWIGGQDVVKSGHKYSDHPAADSPEDLMKRAAEGDNVCFVQLFARLCRKVSVPCITVKGVVKAAAYVPGQRDTCGKGVWAIVYVASGWRFVHPLWAFKFVQNYSTGGSWTLIEDDVEVTRKKVTKEAGETKGHVDEFWFLTDPEDFNFLCHSEEPTKQLMATPWTMDIFLGLPGLKVDCFKSPWKLLGPNTGVITTKNGKCSIDFQHPVEGKGEVKYKLFFAEGQSSGTLPSTKQISQCITRLKKSEGQVSLLIRLPVDGLYRLEVNGVYNGVFSLLGQFCLQCIAAPPKAQPFPSNPDNGFGYNEASKDAGISCPSQTEGVMLVDKGQIVDFDFQMDEDKVVQPRLLHSSRRPDELSCHISVVRKDRQVRIGVDIPCDDAYPEYSLEIYVRDRGIKEEQRKDLSSANDSADISNDYQKRAADAPASRKNEDSEITNDYKRGNSVLDPVTGFGEKINALNYLLTADKELHSESSTNESKQLHKDLLDALETDDEALISQALQKFMDSGLDDPVLLAKVKAREELWRKTRQKLQAAMETKNMSRIDQAIGQFKSHRLADSGEIEPAVNKLMSLSERAVKSAVHSKSRKGLESALKRVRSSHVAKSARATPWYREAESMHVQDRVEELRETVTKNVQTTSVLGFGDKPINRQLLSVLKAAFAVLGEDQEAIKDSQGIKNKLSMTSAGKCYLLDGIKNFQVEQATKNHIRRAKRELSSCNLEELNKINGQAAGSLYVWCRDMVEELSQMWDDESIDNDKNAAAV